MFWPSTAGSNHDDHDTRHGEELAAAAYQLGQRLYEFREAQEGGF
jgi:hypothetical protein